MSQCASCKAPIRWCRTPKGKAMPVDAEPTEGGNLFIDDENVCRQLPTPAPEGVKTYKSHFATCPGAGSHRKPKLNDASGVRGQESS